FTAMPKAVWALWRTGPDVLIPARTRSARRSRRRCVSCAVSIPRWGPLRLVHELAKAGGVPVPSRMSAYRGRARHGLVQPGARRRRKDIYQRWQREAPMALWQIDIMGGAFLADGTEAKIVTGLDDHSRYCVICQVVLRATGRAVCLAFAAALAGFGVPGEVLT